MQNIDPADWTYLESYYCGDSAEAAEAFCEETAHACDLLEAHPRHPEAKSVTYKLEGTGVGGQLTGKCDHCGAWHCWGSVFQDKQGRLMAVGHQCAANTVGLPDKASLVRKRAEQRAAAERYRKAMVRAGIRFLVRVIRETPDQRANIMGWLRKDDAFSADFRRSLMERGSWSDRQVEVVRNGGAKWSEWQKRKAEREAEEANKPPALPAPSGRWQGELKLVHVKEVENEFGVTLKGLWVHADGWKAWFTVPSALNHEVGSTVQLIVTLEPKEGDPTFAWGKRPTLPKAQPVVTTPVPAQV